MARLDPQHTVPEQQPDNADARDAELIERRHALAEQLRETAATTDPAWVAAFATVPRHVFVPRFYRNYLDNGRLRTDTVETPSTQWRDAVYTDALLMTRPDATSSSTVPSLMARMLDALDVHDGHRVLEIGTGTGYGTALLCHRLAHTVDRVHSVDIDPEIVTAARARLDAAGYRASVAVGDGTAEPAHGACRNDRMIVTCRVEDIPPTWLHQLRPGGIIVAPLSTGIVRLTVGPDDTASGRFLPDPAYFMAARHNATRDDLTHIARAAASAPPEQTHRDVDPQRDIDDSEARFWIDLALPGLVRGQAGHAELIYHPDGSWARLADGEVHQGGPRRLWTELVGHYRQWIDLGRPPRSALGLTVTPFCHSVWRAAPDTP